MIVFQNPFFSFAGQAERLSNAGNTILAAVTGKGVESNTRISIIDKTLSAAASNPFVTAGLATIAINPTGALSAGKEVLSKSITALSAAKGATKAKVAIGAAIAIPAIISNPIGAAKTIAKVPSAAINIESNLVKFFKSPSSSSATTIFKENPIAAGGLAAVGVAAAGLTLGGGASIITNLASRAATKENTKAMTAASNAASTIGGAINPETISSQTSAPTLATQSKEAVPGAELTSTPLKNTNSPGIVSPKRRGKITKYRREKGKKGCNHRKVYIEEHLKVRYGGS